MKHLLTIILLFLSFCVEGQMFYVGASQSIDFTADKTFYVGPGVVYAASLDVSSDTVFDGVFQNSVTIATGVRNPFSEYVFDFNGNSMHIGGISTLNTSPFNQLVIMIDSIYYDSLVYTDTESYQNIDLPAGNKRIAIVEGATSMPTSTLLGTRLTGLVLDTTKYTKVTYSSGTEKIVFIVNSIGVGDRTDIAATQAWTRLFNIENFKDVAVYGYGYNEVKEMSSTSALKDTTVDRVDRLLGTATSKKVIVSLGTNDYGLSSTNKNTFATYYSDLVTGIHVKSPTAHIYCVSPIYRDGETSLLADYRLKIDSISLANNDYCTYINPYSALTYPGDYNDAVHPDIGGHKKLKDYIYPITQVQPETDTLIKRFAVNLNREQILGIDSMMVMLKDSGIYNKADLIYIMNVNDSTGAGQNWKSNSYNLTTSGSVDFTSKAGFISTATTGYFNTNWTPSTNAVNFKVDSATIALWSGTDVNDQGYDFGVITNSNRKTFGAIRFITTGKFYGNINGNGTPNIDYVTGLGFHAVSRLQNNIYLVIGKTISAPIADNYTSLPSLNMYLANANNNGSLIDVSSIKRYSFFGAFKYLDQTHINRLNNILTWWNAKANAIF